MVSSSLDITPLSLHIHNSVKRVLHYAFPPVGRENMPKRKGESSACAACKLRRKKCMENCVFAPHFPSSDPQKFSTVKRIFGTSHVLKILQVLPDEQRRDAVNSLVYEATARVRDPVHGCKREVDRLHSRIAELELHLATIKSEVESMRAVHDRLLSVPFPGCNHGGIRQDMDSTIGRPQQNEHSMLQIEDSLHSWEPLWQL